MKLLSKIPPELKKRAVALDTLGIEGYAWSLDDSLDILDCIAIQYANRIVLGGDLFIRESTGDIKSIYADWYFEPEGTLSDTDASIKKAYEYLGQFDSNPQKDKILVDLVISSKEWVAKQINR